MRFFFRLFLLFVLAIALVWVFREPILDRLGLVAGTSARQTGSETRGASGTAERRARGQLSDLDFSVERIAQELRATGRVVRRKVAEAGRQIEESTRDVRTTAKLKARFALDPELKTREIEINTDGGRVTLKGRVDSHEEVARAIRMAVEEDDVLEVTSTLQVSASGAAAEHISGVDVAPQPIRRAQPTATPLP
jgi:hyperosmotically inducible periplasmic protein